MKKNNAICSVGKIAVAGSLMPEPLEFQIPTPKFHFVLAKFLILTLVVSAAYSQVPDKRELQDRVKKAVSKTIESFVFFPGGSGVLISDDGEVLTNHHVAGSGPSTVDVYLSTGELIKAERVGTDSVGDLCLFKLKPKKATKFKGVPLVDSDKMEVGQVVVALGNPFNEGYDSTGEVRYPAFSVGIVSAVHRYQGTYFDTLQTDAAVNPGNSGGPLMTLDGKLAGINGRIATRYNNRVNSGVGYAISARTIQCVLPALRKGAKVQHGQMAGVSATALGDGSVKISNLSSTCKATKAGLKKDDIIVSVDGVSVPTTERFLGLCGRHLAGDETILKVKRDGKESEISVQLDIYMGGDFESTTDTPDPKGPPAGAGWMGVTLRESESEDGVEVNGVREDSPAEKAGLQQTDLIVQVEGTKVKSAADVRAMVWKHKPGDELEVVVRRGDNEETIKITLGKNPDR